MTAIDYFAENLEHYLAELREFTAIESPTGDLERLGAAADFLQGILAPLGELERTLINDHGPLLRLARGGSGAHVVVLAHFDTVWPAGSWGTLWRSEEGLAHAPGIYDMKGGLLFVPWALRFLESENLSSPNLEVLLNPDEEIGSPGSRPYIEEVARRADAVLVLEPSNLDGSLKLARKGSGEYVITIHGHAAHQGVEPEAGINAVVEAAHQIRSLLELEDLEVGTTVGPNVLNGGTASNMVPDRAEIRVDVRAWTADETQRIEAAMRSLQPVLEGSQIHVFGGWNRWPMEPTNESLDLFAGVQTLGKRLGLDLEWVRWGGSSDANVAASVGAPTIDGLGPLGRGAHQYDECVVIDEIPKRLALFSDLLHSLSYLEAE